MAACGLWLGDVGGVALRNQGHDLPQANHIGANLDSFAAAALGTARFQIDDAGIVHTVAALEAVFDSAERNGAWRDIA